MTEAYKSIKEKIIDVYNPHVYCHLWWDANIKENGYHSYNRHYSVPNNTPEIIEKLYSPKKFLIEEEIKDLSTYTLNLISCPSMLTFLSQLISIQKSLSLFDWSDYDFILKWRYDLEVIKFPDLSKLDKTKFYTGYNDKSHYYDDPNFFSDLSYILPNDMKQYSQVISNMHSLKIYHTCVPEHIMSDTLKRLNLREKMIRLPSEEFYCDVIRIFK